MGGGGFIDVRLEVAGRTDFEMDAVIAKVGYECGVFGAAHAVTDTCGREVLQSFPDALSAAGLAGVGCPLDLLADCEFECRNMSVDGETCFVAGEIESDDISTAEAFSECNGFEALGIGEVSQGAEDNSGFDTSRCNGSGDGVVDDADYVCGFQTTFAVEQRGKTDLRIHDIVGLELSEEVGDDGTNFELSLHKREAIGSAGKEVGEIGASWRGDESVAVFGVGDGRTKTGDDFEAQAAIEVDVKFDLGEGVKHGLRILVGKQWKEKWPPRIRRP